MLPKLIAVLSVVALIFPMLFFTLATPPLLVLKHDTPQDGRFVRALFNKYYTVVVIAACVGAVTQVAMGHTAVSLAMAGVAAFEFGLRQWIIPRMDALRERINGGDFAAIAQFRRLHLRGILLNIVQMGVVAWGLAKLFTL